MVNINALLAEKYQAKNEATKLIDAAMTAGHDLKGAELAKYNQFVAKLNTIDAQISEYTAGVSFPGLTDRSGKATPVVHVTEGSFRPSQAGTTRNSPLSAQIQDVYNRASPEVKAQIENLTNYATGRQYDIRADLASSGGVMIPSTVQDLIQRNFAQFDPVRQISKLFTTTSGEPTTFPVISDSESAVAVAEAASTGADATVSGDTPPTSITGPQLHSYKASSLPVLVPRELQEDAFAGGQFAGGSALIGDLIAALVARIIRFENLKFTKGSGSGEQQGFVTAATAYHAGAVPLDLDVALDVAYATPPLYRPRGSYMASDVTIKYLRKLHTGISGDKRALWQNSFQDGNATQGVPPTLHGYPIYVNNDMDNVASDGTFASVNVLAFGDFSRFLVREVGGFGSSVYAYRYLVPARDGIGLVCFRRTDSKLLVPTAITKLVV
jgi:HK97 family phage major capsid protein